MKRFKQIYDISLTLGQQEAVYPGDPEFKQETVTSLADGGIAEVSEFSICAHCGTHLDCRPISSRGHGQWRLTRPVISSCPRA